MNIYHLTILKFIILFIAGILLGISKTGFPGPGIFAVVLVAMVIPARYSVGIVLSMLVVGDIFGLIYYHRHAVRQHLLKLIPWTICGIFIGYFFMNKVNNRQLSIFIGVLILFILCLRLLYERKLNNNGFKIKKKWWFSGFFGLLAGITTMMANAAGPITSLYFLSMDLPKIEFMGTGAWFYFLMNWFKVPFNVNLGLINSHSLYLNLLLIPSILIGALLGITIMKKINQKIFNILVQIFAAIAAIKLIF